MTVSRAISPRRPCRRSAHRPGLFLVAFGASCASVLHPHGSSSHRSLMTRCGAAAKLHLRRDVLDSRAAMFLHARFLRHAQSPAGGGASLGMGPGGPCMPAGGRRARPAALRDQGGGWRRAWRLPPEPLVGVPAAAPKPWRTAVGKEARSSIAPACSFPRLAAGQYARRARYYEIWIVSSRSVRLYAAASSGPSVSSGSVSSLSSRIL